MCLLAIAYKVHVHYPLVVVANRDEFLDRPTRPLHYWEDAPHILAGRDERAGGTWMGLTVEGRFAALTNHRDLRAPQVQGPSRGQLVHRVLEADLAALDERHQYAGFHLIHGLVDDLWYVSNIREDIHRLEAGYHGLSNHPLNTDWPKVRRIRDGLKRVMAAGDLRAHVDPLFALMQDTTTPDPAHLPDTGVGAEWERVLGRVFVQAKGYGTRSTTVLLVDHRGRAFMEERCHHPPARVREELHL